jgi:hypothetical protein
MRLKKTDEHLDVSYTLWSERRSFDKISKRQTYVS